MKSLQSERRLMGGGIILIGKLPRAGEPELATAIWKPWGQAAEEEDAVRKFAAERAFVGIEGEADVPTDVLGLSLRALGTTCRSLGAVPKHIVIIWSHSRKFDDVQDRAGLFTRLSAEPLRATPHLVWVDAADELYNSVVLPDEEDREAQLVHDFFKDRLRTSNVGAGTEDIGEQAEVLLRESGK